MARVAGYGRVSGHEQQQQETIQTQRFWLEKWATDNGHEFIGFYGDEDVESEIPVHRRPEGGRLLRDAARGCFEQVAITRIGRWSRYAQVWHDGRNALNAAGVDLVCLNDGIEDDTPSDRFALGVKLLVTEYERDNIAGQSLDGRYRRVHEGGYVGGVVPYGYRVAGERRRYLVIDEREAETVRLIYRWLVEERWTLRRIAVRLTTMGIPTPCASVDEGRHRKHMGATHGIWRPSTLANLLANPIYHGVGIYGRKSDRRIEFEAPAIIDKETWNAAHRQLEENRQRASRSRKEQYLLTGVVRCLHCERTCTGHTSRRPGRADQRYYVCPRRLDPKLYADEDRAPCPLRFLRADPTRDGMPGMEDDLWAQLLPHLLDCDGTVERLREEMARGDNRATELTQHRDGIRAALDRKVAAERRAVSLATDGLITREEFAQQRQRLKGEAEELRLQLAALDRQEAAMVDQDRHLHDAREWLRRWREQLQEPFTWEKKRAAVEAFVVAVNVRMVDGIAAVEYVFAFEADRVFNPSIMSAHNDQDIHRRSLTLVVPGARSSTASVR